MTSSSRDESENVTRTAASATVAVVLDDAPSSLATCREHTETLCLGAMDADVQLVAKGITDK